MDLALTERDRGLLAGDEGPAAALAMRIIARMAGIFQAASLLDITQAHIDSTIYIGEANLEFAERLAGDGARVSIPTTLNVSALDEHGWREWSVPSAWAEKALRQMAAYQQMGCLPTWTCAPYQTEHAPRFGQQIAWGESNAIVFANSVLGARTARYGDFFDICAALTGRVPEAGLHVSAERRARAVFRLRGLDDRQRAGDLLYPLLGIVVGARAGGLVPAIVGLPGSASEDQLKALGAAAASSGAVAMFHAVGLTPEAATLEDALQGGEPELVADVSAADLVSARRQVCGAAAGPVTAVAMGTPHFSVAEFDALRAALSGRRVHSRVHVFVSTSRQVLAQLVERGWAADIEACGVEMITDTCTYLRPMLDLGAGTVLTNSAKWAWYAPMTLGVDVQLGSLAECVESAVAGRLELDDGF